MVPVPSHPKFGPQPWRETDNRLPGKLEPYFLRNSTGPRYLIGATVCAPLATTAESNGRFTIASIEGSSVHKESSIFAQHDGGIVFEDTHHCFQVSDGAIEFTVNGSQTILSTGETIFIPQGTTFKFHFAARFAKTYVFSNGAGLNELLPKLGTNYEETLPPEKAGRWDPERLEELKGEFRYKLP